jgi:hypothetical protein
MPAVPDARGAADVRAIHPAAGVLLNQDPPRSRASAAYANGVSIII